MLFLTCSFLLSNKLEQLEFKLEKIIGIQKHAGKVRKKLFEVESLAKIWKEIVPLPRCPTLASFPTALILHFMLGNIGSPSMSNDPMNIDFYAVASLRICFRSTLGLEVSYFRRNFLVSSILAKNERKTFCPERKSIFLLAIQ